jgi:hypothetical protein
MLGIAAGRRSALELRKRGLGKGYGRLELDNSKKIVEWIEFSRWLCYSSVPWNSWVGARAVNGGGL